jgi:NADPH:quinone reductase-like Zn-dependent oxidoreductase
VRAVVYDRYGPPEVLRVEDVAKPVPEADEVLVRIHVTTVTRSDCHTREANRSSGAGIELISRLVSGPLRPRQRILGLEFAGEVQAIGSQVTKFAAGDRVFGHTGFGFACHAEYRCVKESAWIALMPSGTGFEEAGAVCDGFLGAYWCLRLAGSGKERKVLVYGASGSMGTANVQLTKHFGAEVTGVCNAKNFDLVRSLGAKHVLDYTKDDFTKNGESYDVIVDAVGKLAFARCKRSLKPGGSFLATDGLSNLFLGIWTSRFGDKKVMFKIPPRYSKQDVQFLKELMDAGSYRAVIDRRYPLEDVVEATKYVETRQKVGNVVLNIA